MHVLKNHSTILKQLSCLNLHKICKHFQKDAKISLSSHRENNVVSNDLQLFKAEFEGDSWVILNEPCDSYKIISDV